MAKSDEVWPQGPISLLDFQPKDFSDNPLLDDSDCASVAIRWNHFIKTMLYSATDSLSEGLKRLAPGADEAVLQAVPELTDPERGGRIDPKDITIRSLPIEVFDKLWLAYEDWPFKPDAETMALYNL